MQKIRIVILAVALVASYAAVGWMRSGYNAVNEQPPVPLTDIPMQLGIWSGEDVELTDDTVQVLNADTMINRVYSDPAGSHISLHSAAWVNVDYASCAPHHPEVCYPAAGWELVERRPSKISTAAGDVPVELIRFRKGEREVISCHWFQMGDVSYTDFDGFQSQRSKFWGAKSWPSTIKFLLTTPQYSIDRAEPALLEFAALLHESLESRTVPSESAAIGS